MSKSYERKIKCIIRKKIQGLRRDIPLLTKLIPIDQIFDFDKSMLSNGRDKIIGTDDLESSLNPATEISNISKSANGATQFSSTTKVQEDSKNHQTYYNNYNELTEKHAKFIWAGSDSNQRPPPCQGGILTRLDHRP